MGMLRVHAHNASGCEGGGCHMGGEMMERKCRDRDGLSNPKHFSPGRARRCEMPVFLRPAVNRAKQDATCAPSSAWIIISGCKDWYAYRRWINLKPIRTLVKPLALVAAWPRCSDSAAKTDNVASKPYSSSKLAMIPRVKRGEALDAPKATSKPDISVTRQLQEPRGRIDRQL